MFINPEKILQQAKLTIGETVVDLGTGSGFYALAAARLVGGQGKVYVLDILESALSHVTSEAKLKSYKNIESLRCDLEEPNSCQRIPDAEADFVIMGNITHQLANRDNLMKEIYRMLKTRGRLLIVDWNDKQNPVAPPDKVRVTEDEAKELANSNNLKFVNHVNTDAHHYGLLFIK
jgi:ubiquinone/menaquinone biosynthesis C-methylase UbiE